MVTRRYDMFLVTKKIFTCGVSSLIRMDISCFHVAINIPYLIMTLNMYYSYHIQVKGNTWDKLSPLIVIIIAWRSSIKDGILGVGAGGGGGGFFILARTLSGTNNQNVMNKVCNIITREVESTFEVLRYPWNDLRLVVILRLTTWIKCTVINFKSSQRVIILKVRVLPNKPFTLWYNISCDV